MQAIFLADISDNDARQWHMRFWVTDSYHESVNSLILTTNYQIGKDSGVCGHFSQPANPKFDRCLSGRVQYELSFRVVISGCGFHATNVGTVAKLSQRETSQVFSNTCIQ